MSDALNLDDEAKQAIQLLKSNPSLYSESFDSIYGKGMSSVVLGQPDAFSAPATVTPPEPEDDGGAWFEVGDTLQGVAHGVAKAGEAIVGLADAPAQWLMENIGTVTMFNPDTGDFDPRVWSGEEVTEHIKRGGSTGFGNAASDYIGAPDTIVGGGVSGITQFVVGWVGPGKFAKAASFIKAGTTHAAKKKGLSEAATARAVRAAERGFAPTKKFQVAEGMVRGAIADFTAFEGSDGNLSNWLHGMGVENEITEGLMTNPEDGELVNRMKTALEGVVLGGMIEGVILAFRARSHLMKGNAEEANKLATEAEKSLKDGAVKENESLIAREQEAVDSTPAPKEINDNPDLEEVTFRHYDAEGETPLFPETASERAARKLNEQEDIRSYNESLRDPKSPYFKGTQELADTILHGSGIRMQQTGESFDPQTFGGDRAKQAADFSRRIRIVTDNDDIQDVLITVGQRLEDQFTILKGGDVQSHVEVRQRLNGYATTLAKLYKESPKKLLDRFSELSPGDYTKLAADLAAKSQFADTLAKHIAQTARVWTRFKEGALDENYLRELGFESADEFKLNSQAMVELYGNLEGIVRGQVTAVARALNAQKMVYKEGTMLNNALIAKMGRSESAMTAYFRDVVEAADAGGHRNIPSPKDIASFWDRLNSLRINFMLSGPNTQIINTVSNFMNMNLLPMEQAMGGALGGNRQEVMRGLRQLGATYGSMWNAMKMAARALKEDQTILDQLNKVEQDELQQGIFGGEKVSFSNIAEFKRTGKSVRSWANLTTTLPSRLLLFSDEFFKQATYSGKLYADLWVAGQKEIADGKLTKDKLTEWIEARSKEAYDPETGAALATTKAGAKLSPHSKAALDIARESTFTTELDGWFASIQAMAIKYPAARFVLPFVRTPTNLLLATYRRAPGVNLAKKQGKIRQDLRSADPSIKAQARGKIFTGWAVTGVAGFLAHSGIITGSGPSRPQERKELIATGWRPYSIRRENSDGTFSYIPYQRYEPLSNFLGIVADFTEIQKEALLEGKKGEEDRVEDILLGIATAMSENTINKTYMRGLSDFMEAIISPERSFERVASGVVKSFSPNIINQLNNDPYLRETRGLLDGLRSAWNTEIGGMAAPRKRNALGEPIFRQTSKAHPFTSSERDPDDIVLNELAAIAQYTGKTFGLPSDRRMGTNKDFSVVPLEDGMSVFETYLDDIHTLKIGGKTLRDRLETLISNPRYQNLSPGTRDFKDGPRVRQLEILFSRYKKLARQKLMSRGRSSGAPEGLKMFYQEYRMFNENKAKSKRRGKPKEFSDLIPRQN